MRHNTLLQLNLMTLLMSRVPRDAPWLITKYYRCLFKSFVYSIYVLLVRCMVEDRMALGDGQIAKTLS